MVKGLLLGGSPVLRFLSRKSSIAFRSSGEREYTLPILGLKALSRFIL